MPYASRRTAVVALLTGLVLGLAGCGRKGPPLPPLRPVPGPVTAVTARRVNGRIELRFTIPASNIDRTSPAAVSRVEIYARSVPEKSLRPVKEQIALRDNLVGTIDVKPPPNDNEAAPATSSPAPPDTRPGTGEATTFTESLPTATPTPLPALKGKAALAAAAAAKAAQSAQAVPPPGQSVIPSRSPEANAASTNPPPVTPPTSAAPTTAAAAAATLSAALAAAPSALASLTGVAPPPPRPLPPMRYYWIQSVSPHGQIGPPSDLIAVPLTDPPEGPTEADITYDEKTLTFTWHAGAAGESYQVYAIDANRKETDGRPLTAAPIKDTQYQAPVVFDKEICLEVRAVEMTGIVGVESDTAAWKCTRPYDHFPPPVPTNLNGLPDVASVTLRWDPVAADDLAGYLVLRGEGTGDTLQQLTPTPITSTTYVDPTVQSGVTYVYVVVAVDKATPPNASPHSNTYTVTIR